MKPGATMSFVASIRRVTLRFSSVPGGWIELIRSPTTQRSARNQGAPVPSTILPPVISRSQGVPAARLAAGAVAGEVRASRRRSDVGRMGGD